MKRTLLKPTKIGEALSLSVEMEGGNIRMDLVSAGRRDRRTFTFDEWENFVDGVKRANASMAGDED